MNSKPLKDHFKFILCRLSNGDDRVSNAKLQEKKIFMI